MKVYLNEGYVKRRSAIGKWASLLGLVILAVGLVISLRSFKSLTQLYISLVSLLVGFILSNVGIYYANRYMRVERPDLMLSQALKGLDNRYVLYQFLLPVSQVLREPGGLTVFLLKTQEGLTLYQGGRWRNKQGWTRLLRWVGQEGLGKPERELENEIQSLQEWLEAQAPDLDVPVRGTVVFTHPSAQLDLDAPPVHAVLPKQIKGWLRKAGNRPALPQETQAQLTEILDQVAQVDLEE